MCLSAEPVIQTLLPLSPAGEICDVDGNCVDAAEDEIFKLTTVGGKLVVESEKVGVARLVRAPAELGIHVAVVSQARSLPAEAVGSSW